MSGAEGKRYAGIVDASLQRLWEAEIPYADFRLLRTACDWDHIGPWVWIRNVSTVARGVPEPVGCGPVIKAWSKPAAWEAVPTSEPYVILSGRGPIPQVVKDERPNLRRYVDGRLFPYSFP